MSPLDALARNSLQALPPLSPSSLKTAQELIEAGPVSFLAFFAHIVEQASERDEWQSFLNHSPADMSTVEMFATLGMDDDDDDADDLDDGLIYRVKITLRGFRPAVYREVEVPNCTLGDLHVVIQAAMGWTNSHLHAFRVGPTEYGPVDDDFGMGGDWDDEDSVSLRELVDKDQRKFLYEYDFGDSWEHDILISKPKPPKKGQTYPHCVKGELACPPEDCGGIYGYLEICDLLNMPKSEWDSDQKERMSWLGKFDPQAFSIEKLNAVFRTDFASMALPPEKPPAKGKKK